MSKNTVILGGSGGIGTSLCKLIDDENRNLFSLDIKNSTLPHVNNLYVDLNEPIPARDAVEGYFNDISVTEFISVAGYYLANNFVNFTPEEFYKSLNINLIGPTLIGNSFANKMIENNGGKIVYVTSGASHLGSRDISYSSAKHGLTGVVKAFAKNFSLNGVYTYAVAPGVIETEMSQVCL